jgi:hypothetical protein
LQPGDVAVSGACPEGGVDKWAIEEAKAIGNDWKEHPPKANNWADGFKPRNIRIARDSIEVTCITPRRLPHNYTGKIPPAYPLCVHCREEHVQSGGCWTVKYAKESLGKPAQVIVIDQEG